MLDIDKIQQLVEMMVQNDLVEVSLRNGEEEINLRRPQPEMPVVANNLVPVTTEPITESAEAGTQSMATAAANTEKADDELVPIPSPMVGTFYGSPDPDSPSFVQVGSTVQPGTIVCILEAMKVFNEIKAEVAGLVERILVKNAEAVEYGQPLFLVRPQ